MLGAIVAATARDLEAARRARAAAVLIFEEEGLGP